MTTFTLAELDEIYHSVKTYMRNETDKPMKPVHQSILKKVDAITAKILEETRF